MSNYGRNFAYIPLSLGAWMVLNLGLFGICRAIFLHLFVGDVPWGVTVRALVRGGRLDVALLGLEGAAMLLILLLSGRVCSRPWFRALWGLLCLHALGAASDLFFFAERTQHFGELFVAYLGDPVELWRAVAPVFTERPVAMSGLAAALVALVLAGWWGCGRLNNERLLFWRYPWRLAGLLGGAICGVVLALEPVAVKHTKAASGWTVKFTHSKYYMRFPRYELNQAVVNPVHELLRVHVPAALRPRLPYRLSADAALSRSLELLGLPAGAQADYPLLRRVDGLAAGTIDNVVIVQVEGLSSMVFDRDIAGAPLMPFLRQLAADGLSFQKCYQGFNATAGALFCTVTGCHKAAFDMKGKRFSATEINGVYAALPRALGEESFTHYFFEAFRQSEDDFVTFMGNQGYNVWNYGAFALRLQGGSGNDDWKSELGVHDGPFLLECAQILGATSTRYTAHIVTSTSHSPWLVPESFPVNIPGEPALTAFAYVDDSIRAFMMALQQQPERYAKTLFVITADHTSGTIAGDQRERMRIPLIFYSPALREQMIEWRQCQMRLAGQVDILPTILYLLGGGRLFAGMGRCLVAETRADPGCISSSRSESFYLTESGMLGYDPYEDEATLALADGTDPSPEQVARARADFLALYEVSRRLVWEHRIVPATIRELPTRDLTSSAGAGGR